MVSVRSYSCISGTTSEEIDTGIFGQFLRGDLAHAALVRRIGEALISETVSASIPCA